MNVPALASEATVKANLPEGVIFERFVKGVRRTETRYPVTCQDCGRVVYRTKRDAGRLLRCQWCANVDNGQKGYRATVTRYGEKMATEKARQWRLDHPSSLEQAVTLLLDERGAAYEREVMLVTKASGKRQRAYVIDFMVTRADGTRGAVEVRGKWVHERPEAKRRDRAKKGFLTRRRIPLLVIEEADIRKGDAEAKLVDFIGQPIRKEPALTTVDCGNEEGATIELQTGAEVVGTVEAVTRTTSANGVTADVYFGRYDGCAYVRSAGDPVWRFLEGPDEEDVIDPLPSETPDEDYESVLTARDLGYDIDLDAVGLRLYIDDRSK